MAFGGGPAVAMRDGKVIVAGGIDWNTDTPIARTEQWERGTWTTLTPMTTPRTGHALLLVNDRPMAIGGFAKYPDGPGPGTSEIFVDGKWGSGRDATTPRARARLAAAMAHGHTAKQDHGFVGNHPGLIASLFAIVITVGFLYALYASAQGHHGGGAPAHGSAPAAAAPHH